MHSLFRDVNKAVVPLSRYVKWRGRLVSVAGTAVLVGLIVLLGVDIGPRELLGALLGLMTAISVTDIYSYWTSAEVRDARDKMGATLLEVQTRVQETIDRVVTTSFEATIARMFQAAPAYEWNARLTTLADERFPQWNLRQEMTMTWSFSAGYIPKLVRLVFIWEDDERCIGPFLDQGPDAYLFRWLASADQGHRVLSVIEPTLWVRTPSGLDAVPLSLQEGHSDASGLHPRFDYTQYTADIPEILVAGQEPASLTYTAYVPRHLGSDRYLVLITQLFRRVRRARFSLDVSSVGHPQINPTATGLTEAAGRPVAPVYHFDPDTGHMVHAFHHPLLEGGAMVYEITWNSSEGLA